MIIHDSIISKNNEVTTIRDQVAFGFPLPLMRESNLLKAKDGALDFQLLGISSTFTFL